MSKWDAKNEPEGIVKSALTSTPLSGPEQMMKENAGYSGRKNTKDADAQLQEEARASTRNTMHK
ncbi:MAG: hypothetical protein CK424_05910 [Legionella sp.]|nr:MAG: hypothetical protein CK424_05910 [Legionella sp.]